MHIRNLKQALLKQRLGLKKIHKVVKIETTKKKKLFSIKAKLSYYKIFYRSFVGYRNGKFILQSSY